MEPTYLTDRLSRDFLILIVMVFRLATLCLAFTLGLCFSYQTNHLIGKF